MFLKFNYNFNVPINWFSRVSLASVYLHFTIFPQSYFLMCIEHDLPALVLFALLILGAVQKKRQVNLETFIFRANLFEEIDKKGASTCGILFGLFLILVDN